MKNTKRIIIVLLWILIAVILIYRFLPELFQKNTHPNVLFITMDTTRADRLGCYGYSKAHTPNIDRLAKNGIVFEQVYTPVPITLPSHISMMSGLYPPEFGIHVNGQGRLSTNLVVLPEIFKLLDYQTAAFVSAPVLAEKYGLNRGFDLYDDGFELNDLQNRPSSGILYRLGEDTTERALDWFDNLQQNQPFFCWIHFFDPHNPRQRHQVTKSLNIPDIYDDEIAYMDMQIERIIGELKSQNILDNTFIIALADHGEGLGDRDEYSHGYMLYDATMHIPMIMSWPTKLPAGKKINTLLPMPDLMPTLLDLLGISKTVYKDRDKQKQVQACLSRSFKAALFGKEIAHRPCYGETDWPWHDFGWSPLRSLRTAEWTFIHAPGPELYDRKDLPPAAAPNVISENTVIAEQMRGRLADIESGFQRFEADLLALTSEQIKQLTSLGYSRPSNTRKQTAVLPDGVSAHQHPEEIRMWIDVRTMMLDPNQYDNALDTLLILTERMPNTSIFHSELGRLYALQNKNVEATAAYTRALSAGGLHLNQLSGAFRNLGILSAREKDWNQAERHLLDAIEADPASALNFNILGNIYIEKKDFRNAVEQYRMALELNPAMASASENLEKALLEVKSQ